ncbi:MAG TPA: hypothetical protein VIC25_04125, partial [Caulobacteraceae bacterium]
MRLAVVFAAGALLAIAPRPVLAQGNGPTSLTSITASAGPDGRTELLLGFNRILPQFSIVTNDDARPVIGFADTVRGNGASLPPGDHGLLKSVAFEQRGAVLTMAFVGAQPLHVTATAIAGRGLSLTIGQVPQAAAAATSATAGTAVGAFADRPPGDDDFVVVPLKYADISEVVGLLSSGPAIKPNDNFT